VSRELVRVQILQLWRWCRACGRALSAPGERFPPRDLGPAAVPLNRGPGRPTAHPADKIKDARLHRGQDKSYDEISAKTSIPVQVPRTAVSCRLCASCLARRRVPGLHLGPGRCRATPHWNHRAIPGHLDRRSNGEHPRSQGPERGGPGQRTRRGLSSATRGVAAAPWRTDAQPAQQHGKAVRSGEPVDLEAHYVARLVSGSHGPLSGTGLSGCHARCRPDGAVACCYGSSSSSRAAPTS
jgi:hypothetical protein